MEIRTFNCQSGSFTPIWSHSIFGFTMIIGLVSFLDPPKYERIVFVHSKIRPLTGQFSVSFRNPLHCGQRPAGNLALELHSITQKSGDIVRSNQNFGQGEILIEFICNKERCMIVEPLFYLSFFQSRRACANTKCNFDWVHLEQRMTQ